MSRLRKFFSILCWHIYFQRPIRWAIREAWRAASDGSKGRAE